MTVQEAQKILNEDIIYKNYTFYITRSSYSEDVYIKCKAPVKDACSGYNYEIAPTININSAETFPEFILEKMNKEDFIKRIYYMCRRIELHELDEHFKVDGKCLYDPHPENKKSIDKPHHLR